MDKISKKVLDALEAGDKETEYVCAFSESWGDIADCDIDEFAKKLGYRTETIRSTVRELEEKGYVEYQRSNGHPVGFHLSHKGLLRKYYRRQEILTYLADKWVDFFSLLLSVAALFVSVISLALR